MRYIVFLIFIISSAYGYNIFSLSLEEKIGQMLIVSFSGDTYNKYVEDLIQEGKVGGVILYNWANGLTDPCKIQKLCEGIQSCSEYAHGIPAFIAADQEGGLVARMRYGLTEFSGNAALGYAQDPLLAYESSFVIGQEMSALGVNFNLAPVVDVNNNPSNPIIGIRAYGDNPELVSTYAEHSLKGFADAGVITCLKHFPGHGNVTKDSHYALPIVPSSLKSLASCEWVPYRRLAQYAPAIMTAHILFPSVDAKHCATLSKTFLQTILRQQLGFQGVVVTDSITMKGVLNNNGSLEEVALKAVQAGNDIILIGGRDLQNQHDNDEFSSDVVMSVRDYLVRAVKDGTLSELLINKSVERILALKSRISNNDKASKIPLEKRLRLPCHLELSREIAYRSLRIDQWNEDWVSDQNPIVVVAPKCLQEVIENSTFNKRLSCSHIYYFDELNPTQEWCAHLLSKIQKEPSTRRVLMCMYNAWKNPGQVDLANNLSQCKPIACIATRDPRDITLCPNAQIQCATHSPTIPSFDVLADWLSGYPTPINISCSAASNIGDKIWYNECAKREDQLLYWHKNEKFPSLGIGHFIWPSKSYKGPFSDGRFFYFIKYLKSSGIAVPDWLLQARYCPWESRGEFYKAMSTDRMKELKKLLVSTIHLQTQYMVERLNSAFYQIVLAAPLEKRQSVINEFFSISRIGDHGVYMLTDYLNFKHEGTLLSERYQGLGWGLLQVLQSMTEAPNSIFVPNFREAIDVRFMKSALSVLVRRIENSPDQDIEKRFLPGWKNRLSTYRISE